MLLTTARDLGAPGIDEIYGWGLMDLRKAIEGYGSLRVDTNVVMNQKAGGLKVWEGNAWDDWTNDIGGPGKLTKSGIGWLRLSGDNSFNGAVLQDGTLELNGANALTAAVEVQGGQFLLNGSLFSTALTTTGGVSTVSASAVLKDSNLSVNGGVVSFNGTQTGGTTTVGANGLLKGVGTLGTTQVDSIIAPGNSIGTLTINGNYVQGATGVYAAELAPGGRSDQLHVTGTATLGGTCSRCRSRAPITSASSSISSAPTAVSTGSSRRPTSARSRRSCSSAWRTAPTEHASTWPVVHRWPVRPLRPTSMRLRRRPMARRSTRACPGC